MRRANILKFIAKTTVAASLGAATLFGGVAHADTFNQRMQAELNKGKDYSAASAVASLADGPLYASELTADWSKALSAMNAGLDYSAAWEVASRPSQATFSPEQVAKAQRARDQLNDGKDYAAAWEATGYEQPAVGVQAKGGGAIGHDRSTR